MEEICWTIAAARLIFGPTMNIQAPPNLAPGISRLRVHAPPSLNHRSKALSKAAPVVL
jgi:hypothetical protein